MNPHDEDGVAAPNPLRLQPADARQGLLPSVSGSLRGHRIDGVAADPTPRGRAAARLVIGVGAFARLGMTVNTSPPAVPLWEDPGVPITAPRPLMRLLDRETLIKIPEVTALFWIIKLLSTAGGEAIADLLATDEVLGMKAALVITGSLLMVSVLVQLAARRYIVVVYWTTVVLVGIAGTLITDYIVRDLGVGEKAATVGFLVALLATFALWYLSERTLSIHSINTTRRELFYWAAVMLTFSLGTAVGDLTAFALGWGFPLSIALYAAVFAGAGIAHLRFGANPIACFWLAYVLTRPLGATTADYLAFEPDLGALGFGLGPVSLAFGTAIVVLVGYLAVTGRDNPTRDPDGAGQAGLRLVRSTPGP